MGLQLLNCYGQLFYQPCFAETLESAATGMVRKNRMEKVPLRDMKKINKKKRGSSDVVTYVSSNITAVRLKDNKSVNAISTFTCKQRI